MINVIVFFSGISAVVISSYFRGLIGCAIFLLGIVLMFTSLIARERYLKSGRLQ